MMCNYDALKMEAVEEAKMNEKESIQVLQAYVDKQKRSLDSIDTTIGNLEAIASNISDISDRMALLLWQMEVLIYPVLLKDIYNLSHAEWYALTTDEILDLVDRIDTCPETDVEESK